MSEALKFPAPGVRIKDLRPCDACGKPLAKKPSEPAVLTAYRLTVDSLILDQRAVQQFGGMAMFFGGNEALAELFAPDPELYKCFGRNEALICFDCYVRAPPAEVMEAARERREEREAEAEKAKSADSQADGHHDEPETIVWLGIDPADPGDHVA